ncbi:ribonuclease J [Lichenicoccus roseus]|uniref:Ribonuclease J n=1 Tax=Lichenicoccus roseus TaxID=2683649 RepID=A0A5R9J7B2_9PROT|nr:ribonuclease J [Lichenicoccus roseus]TLU72733.1 ribonuclease J [Lichenicoccus roseus]
MNVLNGDLAFLPLGGTGEIGMNLNLYRCDGAWLAVDCGIGFSGNDSPEVDILMPDPSYIVERSRDLVGLVITHAHEDHLGAVAHLWPRLRCPVYATQFAAAVLRRKLGEAGLLSQVKLHVIPEGGAFRLEPFDLRFISVTHSVPEAQALVIRTRHGIVLHTGDWKLDPNPLVGPPTDLEALADLGREGVLAMVCDSTNAMVEGESGSEADVRRSMTSLIAGINGRIAVTCFASNVARVESIALAAEAAGRSVVVVGRSLRNLEAAARDCGYLDQVPMFLSEQDAEDVPDDNLLMIVTGSQGEPRSAMSRIALDSHPNISLGEGDTVVFSSRMIPGNERAIMQVQDNLVRRGVRVLTADDHMVHVSGHAARDDLRRLYGLVKPRYSVPVHGEWRHLAAHATLAREEGAQPILLEDGDVLSLSGNAVEVIESVPVAKLALDGNRVVPMEGGVLAARRKMLFNGVVLGSVVMDRGGRFLGAPKVSAPGLLEPDDAETIRVTASFAQNLAELSDAVRGDEAGLKEAARSALRRALGRKLQKRPMVDVHLLRV